MKGKQGFSKVNEKVAGIFCGRMFIKHTVLSHKQNSNAFVSKDIFILY